MDWSNVATSELFTALREGSLAPPRSVADFLAPNKLSLPKTQRKWQSRVKCNIWYFRGNYLILLFCSILVGLAWRRAGLWAVMILSCAAMLANDSVARGLNTRLTMAIRSGTPQLARMLQASAQGSFGLGAPGGKAPPKGTSDINIVGVKRTYVAGGFAAIGLLLLWRTKALPALLWAYSAGNSVILLHSTLRAPNLKARLSNARDEVRSVWRGNQVDAVDYTL